MERKYDVLVIKLNDQELGRQLSVFEKTYAMTNEQFLERYNRGELGDDLPFIRWSALLRTAAQTNMLLAKQLRA